MAFGGPHPIYSALPKWQLPQWQRPHGQNPGSAKYALRVITLVLVFVMLGIFASQLTAGDEPAQLKAKPDAPASVPTNHSKIHGGQHEEFKKQEQHIVEDTPPAPPPPDEAIPVIAPGEPPEAEDMPLPGIPPPPPEEPKVGIPVTKPWYWKVTEKLKGKKERPHPQQVASDLHDAIPVEEVQIPEHTHGDRPYLAKVTVNINGDDRDSDYERGIRTHVVQNKRFNYAMYILRFKLSSQGKQHWSKVSYLLSIILQELAKPPGERLQWLLWHDADTLIANPKVPIETFLPPLEFDDINILLTNDFNGLNNGIFPIRVCLWSVDFLTAVISFPTFNPDVNLQFDEQSAFLHVLKMPKFGDHAVYLPQRWFNAYPGEPDEVSMPYQLKRGDMLIHFAGFTNKPEAMQHWLERIQLHDPHWEVDLRYTAYPKEVRDYWSDVRRQGKNKKAEVDRAQDDARSLIEDIKTYLKEYKSEVDYKRRDLVKEKIKALRAVLSSVAKKEDPEMITAAVDKLREAAEPLTSRARKANHILYQEAHGLLLKFEEEKNELPHDKEIETQYDEFSKKLSSLRVMLVDNKANPRYLERTITDVKLAREQLKLKVNELKSDREKKEKETKAQEGLEVDENADLEDDYDENKDEKSSEDEKKDGDDDNSKDDGKDEGDDKSNDEENENKDENDETDEDTNDKEKEKEREKEKEKEKENRGPKDRHKIKYKVTQPGKLLRPPGRPQ